MRFPKDGTICGSSSEQLESSDTQPLKHLPNLREMLALFWSWIGKAYLIAPIIDVFQRNLHCQAYKDTALGLVAYEE
jgi:hypothetical protein